jgi:hypothetical protein
LLISEIIPSDEDGIAQEEDITNEYEEVPIVDEVDEDEEDKVLEEWDSEE